MSTQLPKPEAHLLYLHGFCSSPQSWKVGLLSRYLAAQGLADRLDCPALSPVPAEALAQARARVETLLAEPGRTLTLVGSSLGGYYCTWLAEHYGLQAVLINPAVVPRLSLTRYLGTQTNLYTGEQFEFTREHVAQLAAMEVSVLTPARYWLWLETGDEVLDYREAEARYQGARQLVLPGGDHSFTRFADYLPQLLDFAGITPPLATPIATE